MTLALTGMTKLFLAGFYSTTGTDLLRIFSGMFRPFMFLCTGSG